LYSSENNIEVIKLRRMRLARHAEHTGEVKNAYRILLETPLRKEEPRWAQAYMEEYYNLSLDTGRDKIQRKSLVNTIINFQGS
jgi:hypothetical protein